MVNCDEDRIAMKSSRVLLVNSLEGDQVLYSQHKVLLPTRGVSLYSDRCRLHILQFQSRVSVELICNRPNILDKAQFQHCVNVSTISLYENYFIQVCFLSKFLNLRKTHELYNMG